MLALPLYGFTLMIYVTVVYFLYVAMYIHVMYSIYYFDILLNVEVAFVYYVYSLWGLGFMYFQTSYFWFSIDYQTPAIIMLLTHSLP